MATLYFRDVGTAWNSTTSWSTVSSTGPSAGVIPAFSIATYTGDDVVFDANSATSCPVSTTIGVCNNITTTGYTGTITLNVDLRIYGNHTIGGSTIFAGAAWYTVVGKNPATTRTITSNGALFPNFQLGVTGPPLNTLTLNDILNVTNIRQGAANGIVTNGSSVNVNGSMTMEATALTWTGTTVYNLTGSANGNFGMSSTSPFFGNTININKSGGTITFLANIRLNGATFTYTAGTVDTTTNSSLFDLYANNTVTSKNVGTGNEILFNNVRAGAAGINGTTTLGSDMRVQGNFTVFVFNGHSFNNNTIFVAGNVINPSGNIPNGGTSILQMSGSSNASITNTGATPSAATGFLGRDLVINKSGGAIVTLTGSLTLNTTGKTYTLTAGTFNPLTSTVSLANDINTTINGFNFYDLTIPGASSVTHSAATTVTNNLTLASNGNITFTGSAGWTCTNLICTTTNRTITLANSSSGASYRTTTNAQLTATAAAPITMTSNNATTRSLWTLDNGAQQQLIYVNGTRIDSSQGQTIWSFGAALTNTVNWATGSRPGTVAYTFVN